MQEWENKIAHTSVCKLKYKSSGMHALGNARKRIVGKTQLRSDPALQAGEQKLSFSANTDSEIIKEFPFG